MKIAWNMTHCTLSYQQLTLKLVWKTFLLIFHHRFFIKTLLIRKRATAFRNNTCIESNTRIYYVYIKTLKPGHLYAICTKTQQYINFKITNSLVYKTCLKLWPNIVYLGAIFPPLRLINHINPNWPIYYVKIKQIRGYSRWFH